jgi:acetylornithine deacetylase/succinyl-diaminopimelate desuccinylase-like protein
MFCSILKNSNISLTDNLFLFFFMEKSIPSQSQYSRQFILLYNLLKKFSYYRYYNKDIGDYIKNCFKKNNYKKIEKKDFIYFFTKDSLKKKILFVAHMDVARIEDINLPKIKKNTIYGNGVCDNLAGCAILLAIKNYVDCNKLAIDVDFFFIKKEEQLEFKLNKNILSKNKNIIIVDGTSSDKILVSTFFWKIFDVELKKEVSSTSFSNIDRINRFYSFVASKVTIIKKKLKSICKVHYLDISNKQLYFETVYFTNKIRLFFYSNKNFNLNIVKKKIIEVFRKGEKNGGGGGDEIKISLKLLKSVDGFNVNKNNKFLKKFKKVLLKNKNSYFFQKNGYSPMSKFKTKNIFMYGPGYGKYAHSNKEFYSFKDGNLVLKNLIDFIKIF